MGWMIKKRKLGRAGGERERLARQKQWDRLYGEGLWAVGYLVNGDFIDQHDAFDQIYYKSYEQHFANHPTDLAELVSIAKELRNPHAEATSGVDLQVPAVSRYLAENDLELQGDELVDIGTWQGKASHPISIRLSPLQVKCWLVPKWTIEKFWQDRKVLAVWEES